MSKRAKELSAMAVSSIKAEGLHAVGGVPGLCLQIIGESRSWILRIAVGTRINRQGKAVTRRRDMGLGAYPEVSLAEARRLALESRAKLREGIDPIAERQRTRACVKLAAARTKTYRECAEAWIETNRAGWVAAYTVQLESSMARFAYPIIGGLSVAGVDTGLVLEVLQQPVAIKDGTAPLWEAKPTVATLLRARIESILDFAKIRGFREGDNPADWKTLKHVLPSKNKIHEEKNHPALPYMEIGAFMVELRKREGVVARALEFAILTAARSKEVRGATWDEIDFASRVWTIPAARMKKKREHSVPLSDAAVKLLETLQRREGNNHIFPAAQAVMLPDTALLKLIRRMHEEKKKADGTGWTDPKLNNRVITSHGFRSAFRDWAGETTPYPREVIEHALAHSLADKAEAAYQRGTLFDKRKGLMESWSQYCDTVQTANGNNVVSIMQQAV
jgi:integrase